MTSSRTIPATRWIQEAATVTLRDLDAPRDGLASALASGGPGAVALPAPRPTGPLHATGDFLRKTFTIAEWEARKLLHDPSEIITRAVQPLLWLLVFGEVFARVRPVTTGKESYLEFMSPGILAQSVLFLSIFYGIAIIWERDLGVIHKFLASPTPRTALVLGKAISAGIRALPQAVIVYILAAILGVPVTLNPLHLLGLVLAVFLGAACFSTFSLVIACLLRTRERVMGIGQVLTMPLFFASNAIYPIAIMPAWLQVVAHANPLSYDVDALRGLMTVNGTSVYPLALDYGVLFAVTAALVLLGARLYIKIVQ
jgi:ABC-2 type transport system permease protein